MVVFIKPAVRKTLRFLLLLAVTLSLTACGSSPSGRTAPTYPDTVATVSTETSTAVSGPTTIPTALPLYLTLPPLPARTDIPTPGSTTASPSRSTAIPSSVPTALPGIRFAVIGDYGLDGPGLQQVANLVKSWQPDFIITTGDNNYPDGSANTIDDNIGKYFHDFIANYKGIFGNGASQNRFFPTLGNHDWVSAGAQPYLDYFSLPGNGRYYSFTWGPVEFFALDSNEQEPDGVGRSSIQASWLKAGLAASHAPWRIVYFHHAPFSSGITHGSTNWMQWPFQAWGASAVLSGHEHTYERLLVDGIPYIVDGLGGASRYNFGTPLPQSQVRYSANFGALLIVATSEQMTFQFININGEVIDQYSLKSP
jgi:tartrate-resistant acid phosphatase type 5